jgi:ferric-dicitrate binding protein FerR (iron transport regulator)
MNEGNLHISALELAEEAGFIEWVNGHKTSDAKAWDSWINSHPEIQEKVLQAKSLVEAISFYDHKDLQKKEDAIWTKIKSGIGNEVEKQPAKTISLRRYITVAAIAASLILPLFIFLGDSNKLIRATNGEQLSYNFPDQSSTQLNSGSSIEYNPLNWETNREVVLKGEAFFQVERGNQFEVVTNNGSVTVLGTSFNVLSRGKTFEVSCLTGKVEVKTKEHTLVLNPGDAVFLNNDSHRLEPNHSLKDLKVDWLEGEYNFENTKLKDVFDEMERQFNVEIKADKQALKSNFTGFFTSENIDSALYQVCWPMNLESNKINNKIVISRSGTE